MKTKFFSVLAAATTFAGVVATTGSAKAASLSTTASSAYDYTDITNTPLSIQKFNSNLGQLNSVEIDFTTNILGDASYINTGAKSRNVTVNLSADVTLGFLGQTLFDLTPTKTYGPYMTPNDGKTHYLPGLTTTATATDTITNSSLLQSFTGTGNLDFLFSAIASSYVSGGGNLSSQIDTQARGSVNVIYNYTASVTPHTKVPEPSALLGIGLVAGFGLLSQRKRSFSQA